MSPQPAYSRVRSIHRLYPNGQQLRKIAIAERDWSSHAVPAVWTSRLRDDTWMSGLPNSTRLDAVFRQSDLGRYDWVLLGVLTRGWRRFTSRRPPIIPMDTISLPQGVLDSAMNYWMDCAFIEDATIGMYQQVRERVRVSAARYRMTPEQQSCVVTFVPLIAHFQFQREWAPQLARLRGQYWTKRSMWWAGFKVVSGICVLATAWRVMRPRGRRCTAF